MNLLADFLNSGIRLTTPILFCAIASALSARAGVLNLAIESKMLTGAFIGIVVAAATGNNVAGLVAAALAAGLIGLLMAAVNRLGVDLVVFAIGLNILVLELTVYLMRTLLGGVGTWSPGIEPLPVVTIPFVSDLPLVGRALNGLNGLVFLSLLCAIGLAIYFRSKSGRHLLAVGESPQAAAAVGISIGGTQTFALFMAGILAGLGGAFLSVGDLGLFTRGMSDERGWIGITAALLALNRPALLVPAAMVFGFADAASIRLQSITDIPPTFTQFIPQFAALMALIIVGVRAKSRSSFLDLWRRNTTLRWRKRAILHSQPPVRN